MITVKAMMPSIKRSIRQSIINLTQSTATNWSEAERIPRDEASLAETHAASGRKKTSQRKSTTKNVIARGLGSAASSILEIEVSGGDM
jgi:hypothetical protein